MSRLGSTAARLKLKGIDGGPHKRRSMWLNSTQREEPYQGLTYREISQRCEVRKGPIQVVHGCRQLVSGDVGLSPATSATLVLCCQHVMVGTHRRLRGANRRKGGMTSSHHAPYVQGFTHA